MKIHFRISAIIGQVILTCFFANAQVFCAFPARNLVPVYDSATSYVPVTYLTSIAGSDICYDCEIIENSPLRFKVRYNYPLHNDGPVGWINKSDLTGVVLSTADGDGGFYLYENYTDTQGEKINTQAVDAHPLDIHFGYDDQQRLQQLFTKVIFSYDGKIYTGWVKRFCGDQYQSCN